MRSEGSWRVFHKKSKTFRFEEGFQIFANSKMIEKTEARILKKNELKPITEG